MKKGFKIAIGMGCLLLLVVLGGLFVPVKTSANVTVPAMILRDGQLESTGLSIDGTWKHPLANASEQTFSGAIVVDSLEYTHKENTWELDFQLTNDMYDDFYGDYLTGGFFYNETGRFTGYGWLYTDEDHDVYVLVTNRNDSQNEDYIVIAPAESEEEARKICDKIGLNYLKDDAT